MKLLAVLTSTVLPLDGVYAVKTVPMPDIQGVPHFIGHPDTKTLVESLGAVKADSNLFEGLQVGESAIAVPLAKPRNDGANDHTSHQVVADTNDLTVRLITRLEDEMTELTHGWHCMPEYRDDLESVLKTGVHQDLVLETLLEILQKKYDKDFYCDEESLYEDYEPVVSLNMLQ